MVMTDIIRVDWSIWPTDHYHDLENYPHPSLTKHNSHIANRDEITSCNSRHVHYNTTSTCSTSVGEWPLLVGNEASALYHGVGGAGDAVHLDKLCQGYCAWVGWLVIGVCVIRGGSLWMQWGFQWDPVKREITSLCARFMVIFSWLRWEGGSTLLKSSVSKSGCTTLIMKIWIEGCLPFSN